MAQDTRLWSLFLLSLFLTNHLITASYEISFGSDDDLTNFVTRPEIKAPILDVAIHSPATVAPGYFFVAPYARIHQEKPATSYYEPCQTGSHIYDQKGNLVWSGACIGENQNMADFRPYFYQNSYHLSAIQVGLREDSTGGGDGDADNYAYVLNSIYYQDTEIDPPKGIGYIDMYEFNVVDDGRSALFIMTRPELRDVSTVLVQHELSATTGWVQNSGFQEVDLDSGEVRFEWWSLDHVELGDSTAKSSSSRDPLLQAWDFCQLNSVDKSPSGEYLLSARNMNSVYLISGENGSIKWRLGGKSSSIVLEGFHFSRQHNARFVDRRMLPFKAQQGHQYISLMDNASDGDDEEAEPAPEHRTVSSILVIDIDEKRNVARLVYRIERPDGETTTFGGNGLFLPNGNLFAAWAGDAYMTEHAPDSRLVAEARFRSDRFTTYRAYKSDFAARPSEDELYLTCLAYGTSAAKATSVCYVSWNGATEVRKWRLVEASEEAEANVLGIATRTGFESRIQVEGYVENVFVEGLDAFGDVLGRSKVTRVRKAVEWSEESRHHDL